MTYETYGARCYRTARKVPAAEWAGPVFRGLEDETYYDSVDDLLSAVDDDGEEPPKWVWGGRTRPFAIDADDIIDRALEGHHGDAELPRAAREALQDMLDEWLQRDDVRGVVSVLPDEHTVVVLTDEVAT